MDDSKDDAIRNLPNPTSGRRGSSFISQEKKIQKAIAQLQPLKS